MFCIEEKFIKLLEDKEKKYLGDLAKLECTELARIEERRHNRGVERNNDYRFEVLRLKGSIHIVKELKCIFSLSKNSTNGGCLRKEEIILFLDSMLSHYMENRISVETVKVFEDGIISCLSGILRKVRCW